MLTLLRKAWPIGMLLVGWFSRAERVGGTVSVVELIELAQAIIVELDLQLAIEIPPELGPAFGLAPAGEGDQGGRMKAEG